MNECFFLPPIWPPFDASCELGLHVECPKPPPSPHPRAPKLQVGDGIRKALNLIDPYPQEDAASLVLLKPFLLRLHISLGEDGPQNVPIYTICLHSPSR